jgi:hypothetical protein
MTSRAQRAAARRTAWHQGRVGAAQTRRERFWAACGWLLAELIHADDRDGVDDATEMVLTRVHEVREGRDDNRYAA